MHNIIKLSLQYVLYAIYVHGLIEYVCSFQYFIRSHFLISWLSPKTKRNTFIFPQKSS